jgi:hypothetical protein
VRFSWEAAELRRELGEVKRAHSDETAMVNDLTRQLTVSHQDAADARTNAEIQREEFKTLYGCPPPCVFLIANKALFLPFLLHFSSPSSPSPRKVLHNLILRRILLKHHSIIVDGGWALSGIRAAEMRATVLIQRLLNTSGERERDVYYRVGRRPETTVKGEIKLREAKASTCQPTTTTSYDWVSLEGHTVSRHS